MPHSEELEVLRAALGHKRLSRSWAKAEILLGLAAAGAGLLLGDWSLNQPAPETAWGFGLLGLALFVLGGYLALVGHRSHIYQSNNELAAYLAGLLSTAPRPSA